MSGCILGYELDKTVFSVASTNTEEVARFGTCNNISQIHIYASSRSNDGGYVLQSTQRPSASQQDFAIQLFRSAPSPPPMFIQGTTGRVGIGTSTPSHLLSVQGDIYIDGQIFQRGTNQIIQSEIVQSTTVYADFLYSSNEQQIINFTGNNITNIKSADIFGNVSVGGSLSVSDSPIVHTMGNMQRYQVHVGQVPINTPGTHTIGFTLSWIYGTATSAHMFEVSGSLYMSGTNVRQYHRFVVMVNPTDNAVALLPGLDVIVDQNSMISDSIGKTKVDVKRNTSKSVRVYVQWTSSLIAYTANMKLDVFAPKLLGTLSSSSFVT